MALYLNTVNRIEYIQIALDKAPMKMLHLHLSFLQIDVEKIPPIPQEMYTIPTE